MKILQCFRSSLLVFLLTSSLCGTSGEIIKNFLESVTKECSKQRVTDKRYYIIRIRELYILRQCRNGLLYSPLMCDCVPVSRRGGPSSSSSSGGFTSRGQSRLRLTQSNAGLLRPSQSNVGLLVGPSRANAGNLRPSRVNSGSLRPSQSIAGSLRPSQSSASSLTPLRSNGGSLRASQSNLNSFRRLPVQANRFSQIRPSTMGRPTASDARLRLMAFNQARMAQSLRGRNNFSKATSASPFSRTVQDLLDREKSSPLTMPESWRRGVEEIGARTGSSAITPQDLPGISVPPPPQPVFDSTTRPQNLSMGAGNNSTNSDGFCRPYFQFQFDKSFLSSNKSIPSQPSSSIKFVPISGSTGSTAALFQGDGAITVWSMSYITFANKLKFSIRFKLKEGYKYKKRYYNLLTDGPCHSQPSRYRISVSPRKDTIQAVLQLRNKDELDLRLKGVNLDDWVTVTLEAKDGDVRLYTENKQITGVIGASTVKSSPCPLEIGKKSPEGESFVGYIDTVQFHNCFGQG